MKYILVELPNDEIVNIPLIIIAINRAEYYAKLDGFEDGSPEWNVEIKLVMEDSYEGKDWIANNTYWLDPLPGDSNNYKLTIEEL